MALIKHNETGENLTSEDLSRLLRGAMLSIVNWPPEDSFTDSNAQATFSPGPRPSCTGTPPASTAASPVPTPDRGTARDSRHVKILNFGRYKGQSYEKAYQDASYVNWVLGELNEDSNPIFMHLGRYFEDRRMAERSNTAFMATKTIEVSDTEEDFPTSETIASETDLIAILDSGCNKTCHGELWLRKYAAAVGHSIDEFPMNPETGSFRGIGGSVTVLGLRSLQVGFELADGGIAIGDIDSTELQGSSAPLLLSIGDQRKLGLCIELGNTESVFSRTFNCQLKIAEINGLLGLRLLPSHIAMMSQISDAESTEASSETLQLPATPSSRETEFNFSVDTADTMVLSPKSESEDNATTDSESVEFSESYIALDEETNKTMTKQQKKQLEKDLAEVKAHDQCLWSTLKSSKTSRPLPRGCRTFLLEIFPGAALLTSVANGMGYPVSTPVDIVLDETNILDPRVRQKLDEEIERDDPYIITFAPICGPWSSWQRLNCSRSPETAAKVLEERDLWYPTLKWVCKVIKSRLQKGRKVLVENPWFSELWSVLSFDKLIQESLVDAHSR